MGDRNESKAFLAWFLKHYYRLDETEALDAVCDGTGDRGIDGIYVDHNAESIDVLQSKMVKSPARTQGDKPLREFVGSLAQLRDPASVEKLAQATCNQELANLLEAEKVAELVKSGYTVRGVFLTNAKRDQNAIDYLDTQTDISLYDRDELETRYISVGRARPSRQTLELDVEGQSVAEHEIGDVKVVIAPIKARDLVLLDGIASGELFASNVRGHLGRTKVNKDIAGSIADPQEHENFLLFHNGLTVLCEELSVKPKTITITGSSVVNGCQSLTSFYEHRNDLTDDLRVILRLIRLAPDSPLAEKITHHSNNQNSIGPRDMQSNSIVQRRLQNEFKKYYHDSIFYEIKRGESSDLRTISNDEAGRALLAFDLKQPWSCHQTYKVFDELHSDIFSRPEVDAHRIVAIADLADQIAEAMTGIQNELFASYRLSRYFMMYLVREALETDEEGRRFCSNPADYLTDESTRTRTRECMRVVADDLVIDVNGLVKDLEDEDKPLDYKRDLKSPSAVRALRSEIIPQYQKAVSRGRATSFGQEWEAKSA